MRIWVLAVLLASGAAWAQLPINSNLPVSFGVNSKQGERLDGTFTDVRVYARVLNPREIARLSRGAAISDDRLVWRGVPKIGETCDAVKQGDYRLGFTFAATVTANGKSGRLIDNVTPGGKDGWLIDIYQNKFRIVLSGGANNFHPTELELGKPYCLVATVAADGAWALWVDGKRHEPLAQAAPAPRRGWELLYDRPAANWNAALPVGNGRLGAMVFGGIAEERLQLNEDTIWSGSPGPNDDPGATPEQFRKSRELVFAGNGREAQRTLPGDYTRSAKYQPFGDLVVKFGLPEGEASGYERTLSLDEAVAASRFMQDGVVFKRETFASFTDDAVIFRAEADYPGEITFEAFFDKPWPGECVEDDGQVVFTAVTGDAPRKRGGQLRFEGRLAAKTEGGTVETRNGRIFVKGADAAVLYVSIGTNFKRYDDLSGDARAKCVAAMRNALAKPYAQARAAHTAFYKSQADRCTLWLGRDAYPGTPTDVRLRDFRKTGDTYLPALYFRFGRYLMISGSQPGTQPTNLQGIWNKEVNPPWNANYTVNINTEMNYWPAEPTGLGDLAEPIWRMCDELSVTGARAARTVYGAEGWTTHHNTDLWRIAGPAGPTQCGTWPSGGAWLSMHIWYHWLYTHDRDFLAAHYDTLKGAADFYVSYMVKDPETGKLTVCPSCSPENVPNGKLWGSALTHGAAMDHSLARDILNAAAGATEILGKDAAYAKRLRAVAAEVEPFHIGSWGQLQEWTRDFDNPNDTHRHTSHLYGLYPSDQITPETPELFQAARVSLEHRGDISTGWAMGWRVCLWARLLDGNHAYKLLQNQLRPVGAYAGVNYGNGGGTYINLFDAHPPFQIDGNFGCAAGIAEMLLQSHRGALDLLPALPDAWPEGRVTGLRGQHGFAVEIVWMEGRLVLARIRSELGEPCKVRYAGKIKSLSLKKGETAVLTEGDF